MTESGVHGALAGMWLARQFEPQVHHVRFPRFRNLDDGLQIDFSHPITAIVGPNGTNKSSILRALQGCPDYENIGRYWFGTALDVISPDERHRFIHGRWSDSASEVVEVLKTRIQRKAATAASDPDYFEPSRPILSDGMNRMPEAPDPMPADRTRTRWKAIDKEVVYVDFRAEISAFDKYFLHHDYRSRRADSSRSRDSLTGRKSFIRDRAPRVKRIFERRLQSYKMGGSEWIVEPPKHLESDEVAAVSRILGRDYTAIEVLSHGAFGVVGTTARLTTTDFSYTEAWAGSGEFAAVQVVTAVMHASPKSLVLLDEPEVSLHPGAQRRLLAFLAERAKTSQLQIVFATHSPVLIEDLPASAIKVLDVHPQTHRVVLRAQESSAEQAFATLEHRFLKKTVVVEDELARQIVLKALRGDGANLLPIVDVRSQPGGASSLLTRFLPPWALEGRTDTLLILDGDARLVPVVPQSTAVAPSAIRSEVERLLGTAEVDRYIPANTGGPDVGQLSAVLDWGARYVRFLPGDQPEDWLRNQITPDDADDADAKEWWRARVHRDLGKTAGESVTAAEILEYQKHQIAALDVDMPDLVAIRHDVGSLLGVTP